MKKFMSLVFAGVAVFALSGCGGGDDTIDIFTDVDIEDLKDGLIVSGENEARESVEFKFCKGDYKYTIGNESFIGTYLIVGDTIELIEENKDVYSISTDNGLFEVGDEYDIDGDNNEIIVEVIREDLSC